MFMAFFQNEKPKKFRSARHSIPGLRWRRTVSASTCSEILQESNSVPNRT